MILSGEIPKEHVAQCQGGLWISEREWIDFVCYWPGMPLFIKRAYRDEALIRKLSERVKTFYEILRPHEPSAGDRSMISNHLSLVEALRPASDELAAAVDQYLAAGGWRLAARSK